MNDQPESGKRNPRETATLVYDILANDRRRRILHALRERDDPMSVHDVVVTVTAWEAGRTIPIAETDQYEQVAISLYHTHLPKLADADLINYDIEREQVALTGTPHLTACLNAVADTEVV